MQIASSRPQPNFSDLLYQDGVSNGPSQSSRLDEDSVKESSPSSVHGSMNTSLTERNQATISDEFSLRSNTSRYFLAEINTECTDVLLIVCSFVSGLVDGLSFNAWGNFSSMQTGASNCLIKNQSRNRLCGRY